MLVLFHTKPNFVLVGLASIVVVVDGCSFVPLVILLPSCWLIKFKCTRAPWLSPFFNELIESFRSTFSCCKEEEDESKTPNYDKEKYREMILDAAETVLGPFGFDRTVYVDTKKRKGKWWQELI
jgi:hypothetical protein